LHGVIGLETGPTSIMDVETVDAQSAIALFEALEQTHSTMGRIHVFLDNARYHHAKVVRAGCSGQEGASSCTSCRPIALISTRSSGCGR
jgi:hypothetical protein